MAQIIKHIILQAALAACFWQSGLGQYTNELVERPVSHEFAQGFMWQGDTLVYSYAQQDSVWDNYGYNSLHINVRNSVLDSLNEIKWEEINKIYNPLSTVLINNNYFVCGFKDSAYYGGDTTQGFLSKFDSNGNLEWEKRLFPLEEIVRAKQILSHDSLVVVAGHVYNPVSGIDPNKLYGFIIALDTINGDIVWNKTFDNYNFQTLNFNHTSDGGFLLSGYTQLNGSQNSSRVYKLDNQGNTQWVRFINDITKEQLLGAHELPNGDFLCYGYKDSSINFDRANFVLLNSSGQIVKDTIYSLNSEAFNDDTYFLSYTDPIFKSDGFYMLGRWYTIGNAVSSFLAFFDYDLNLIWMRDIRYRYYKDYIHYLSFYPPNPNYLFMGGVSYPTPGNTAESVDAWFVIVDSMGCEISDCWSEVGELELEEQLFKVYPNPSRGEVWVSINESFSVGDVYELIIMNVQGELVDRKYIKSAVTQYQLIDQEAGVYLIHLVKDGERLETQKLILTN